MRGSESACRPGRKDGGKSILKKITQLHFPITGLGYKGANIFLQILELGTSHHPSVIHFEEYSFVWKLELQEIFYTLVQSQSGWKGRSWTQSKPGARDFILISHKGDRDPSPGLSFSAFSIARNLDLKWSTRGTNWCLHGMLTLQLVVISTSHNAALFLHQCYDSNRLLH